MRGYSSEVNIGLSQELLKNSFGYNDRLTEKSLLKASEIRQREAKQAVSESLMSSFIAYWNYIMADENYKTAQIAYNNTQDIRNLVRRKSRAGISEKEELYDWEGRVLQAKNILDGSGLALLDARLAVQRELDMDRDSDIEIVRNLTVDAPTETFESAVRIALANRADLRNIKAAIEISEMNLSMAKNSGLPSVRLSGGLGYNDYDQSQRYGAFSTENRQWNVSVMVSAPLCGTYDEANIESAKRTLSKTRITEKQLEDGIRDEIRVRIAKCEASYRIYRQTAQSGEYARAYYDQVYKRFSQGRYESAQLKLAFDNYIALINYTLKTLIDYNVSMLELDIAKNAVFEKYSIDIDAVISRNTQAQ
jgi:outer membrane protein TolC